MPVSHVRVFAALLFTCVPALAAQSTPCSTGWDPNFAAYPYGIAPDGPVYSSAVFDDGSGPKLYVGGDFGRIGNRLCRSLACWDGHEWSALGDMWSPDGSGAGIGRSVRALAVYDDGSGPALYAGGTFTTGHATNPAVHIARWNGTSWSVPGAGISAEVRALLVHDDGSGQKLFAGGTFNTAGGLPASHLASWNGTSWSPVGSGSGGVAGTFVESLASYDDGAGRKLFVGGKFSSAGGVAANNIARWDGSSWSALGTGVVAPTNGGVLALHVYDDGSGGKLCVGGSFVQAGGQAVSNIARWDGASWSTLGTGFVGDVRALAHFDDGGGMRLYAGGFCFVSGQPEFGFYRWDGAVWSGVGGGVTVAAVECLQLFDDGGGARLLVGGGFLGTGTLSTPNIAAWGAGGWSSMGTLHAQQGPNGLVAALAAHDDGSGPALFAGGYFGGAGGTDAIEVARWNGVGWSALGAGLQGGTVEVLASFDDGSGSALYAGGAFTNTGAVSLNHVARWNGSSWSPVAGGLGGAFARICAMQVFDDGSGPALYAAGTCSASAGNPMLNIARWNGSAWSALAGGVGAPANQVRALCVFDDGSGPALYAGGNLAVADGVPVHNIARWNGTSWSAVGGGVGTGGTADFVAALCVFDDGSGPALYAGGAFLQADGVSANALARWNGTSWSAVPGALSPAPQNAQPVVFSLRVVDDGSGPALSVGGRFSAAGTTVASCLARWNGSSWTSLGDGLGDDSPTVLCQEFFDDGSGGGADLYVGGSFFSAGGYISNDFARWNTCAETYPSFCAGDASLAPCPCANTGLAGHGCENSAATGGSLLAASGLVADDSVVLAASGELPSALTIFLQGDVQIAPAAFGDGLRCVGGALKRLYAKNATGGAASAPQAGDAPIRARSAALGDVILPGELRRYQAYYRDANAGFCPAPLGSTFNVSNGVAIRW